MSRLSIRIEEAIVVVLALSATTIAATDSNRSGFPAATMKPVVRSTTRVSVFIPVRQNGVVKLTEHTLSVPGGVEPRVAAIEYLARPGGVLPKGTRVRGLTQEEGVLHIDFSPELRQFSGGSSAEATLFAALSATVAQFDGVKAMQLSVQNRPIEILGGHVDLSEPYPVAKELPEDFR